MPNTKRNKKNTLCARTRNISQKKVLKIFGKINNFI